MGALATYLQQEFMRLCPDNWTSKYEMPLMPRELAYLLGYAPRVDVLLERKDGSKRLWIEFEISRADPVANHAKFATSHLFQPQPYTDSFVAMVSPHVARGRRNLAANTISLMRCIGMNAFQTVLFPHLSGQEIKRLNHLPQSSIMNERLNVKSEIERVFLISEAVFTVPERRIHFAGDILDVMLNLRSWNKDMRTAQGEKLWGRRTITYFVYEPRSGDFGPSKFCAFVGLPARSQNDREGAVLIRAAKSEMTMELYAGVDDGDRRFDGRRARIHLTNNLGMIQKSPQEDQNVLGHFHKWLSRYTEFITIHPAGPTFIVPPRWFQ
jgi:hypothetical protein